MSQSMNAAGPLHSRIENKPSKKKTLLSLAVVKVHLTESLERTESDIREICYQDKIFLHKKNLLLHHIHIWPIKDTKFV